MSVPLSMWMTPERMFAVCSDCRGKLFTHHRPEMVEMLRLWREQGLITQTDFWQAKGGAVHGAQCSVTDPVTLIGD